MRGHMLAAFLIANFALLNGAEAAVRVCKANVVGQRREASSEVQARTLALESWMTEARKAGSGYAAWRLAINRKLVCEPTQMKTHRCQASGHPCTISQVPPKGMLKKSTGKGMDI